MNVKSNKLVSVCKQNFIGTQHLLSWVCCVWCSATGTRLGSCNVHMWPLAHSLPPWFVAWCSVWLLGMQGQFSQLSFMVLWNRHPALGSALGHCKPNYSRCKQRKYSLVWNSCQYSVRGRVAWSGALLIFTVAQRNCLPTFELAHLKSSPSPSRPPLFNLCSVLENKQFQPHTTEQISEFQKTRVFLFPLESLNLTGQEQWNIHTEGGCEIYA